MSYICEAWQHALRRVIQLWRRAAPPYGTGTMELNDSELVINFDIKACMHSHRCESVNSRCCSMYRRLVAADRTFDLRRSFYMCWRVPLEDLDWSLRLDQQRGGANFIDFSVDVGPNFIDRITPEVLQLQIGEIQLEATEGGYIDYAETLQPPMMNSETESRSIKPLPMIESVVAYYKQRLGHCLQHYQSCYENGSEWIPDRLLHIKKHLEMVQLVSIDKQSTGNDYVALSHCWGSSAVDDKLILTQSNFDSLSRGVGIRQLAKSFRDAVQVTTPMGFEHLWIDSLCIIQDSKTDWQTQSKSMGYVYMHAILVISALSAASDHEGFLDNHNADEELGLEVALDLSPSGTSKQDQGLLMTADGESNTVFDSTTLVRILRCYDDERGYKDLDSLPLLRRAWVFQESVFAKRALAFDNGKPLWLCRPKPGRDFYWSSHGVADVFGTHKSWAHVHQEMDFVLAWRGLVKDYSKTQLSRREDRLIALAGICLEISLQHPARHLAGLWYHSDYVIGYLLLWRSVRPLQVQSPMPPLPYVAPSWSWACLDAPVEFSLILQMKDHEATLLDIVSIETDLEDASSPFGQVKGGRLHARGRLYALKRRSAMAVPDDLYDLGRSRDCSLRDHPQIGFRWYPDSVEGSHLLATDSSTELYAVPILAAQRFDCMNLGCLVLVQTHVPGQYRRVGFVTTYFRLNEEYCEIEVMKRFLQELGQEFEIIANEGRDPSLNRDDPFVSWIRRSSSPSRQAAENFTEIVIV